MGTGVYDRDPRLDERGGASVPLAAWLGGWRGALIAISCVALVSLVAWIVLTWSDHPPRRLRPFPAAVAQSHGLAPRRDLPH